MQQSEKKQLSSITACPYCLTPGILGQFKKSDGMEFYQCRRCNRIYPVDRFGVIDFQVIDKMVSLPEPYWGVWALSQQASMEEYRIKSPASVASEERKAAVEFSEFIKIDGLRVLDVGGGMDYIPVYISRHAVKQHVALDPLPAERPVSYTKIQGWAELMPFRDATFDAAILGTSLDHVLCLESVFRELFRCLKNNGQLYIWGAFYIDNTAFKNIPSYCLFERKKEDIVPVGDSLAKFKADSDYLGKRFNDIDVLRDKYAGLLVDRWHLRHIPMQFLDAIRAYKFGLEDFDVFEFNFNDGRIFMNAFLKFVKTESRAGVESEAIKRYIKTMTLLSALTEKVQYLGDKVNALDNEIKSVADSLTGHMNAPQREPDAVPFSKRLKEWLKI